MNVLTPGELLEIAIKIEVNGEKFYRHAVQLADDPKAKETFAFLADEEVKHQETFTKLISGLDTSQSVDSYPQELLAYVTTYTRNIIFPEGQLQTKLAEIKDTLSAIDFAIQRELDAVHYYQEIKQFIREAQHAVIDEIIAEERRHFLQLVELKSNLG